MSPLRIATRPRAALFALLAYSLVLSVAAQDGSPLRAVSLSLADVLDEDAEARRTLTDLTLAVTLAGPAAAEIVGVGFELPGLVVARCADGDQRMADEHGYDATVYTVPDDDGTVVWYVSLQRAEPFRIEGGELRLELFGEPSSARFVAALGDVPGGALPRAMFLAPEPGAEVAPGSSILLAGDEHLGNESVTIETIRGPQRALELGPLELDPLELGAEQPESGRSFIVPTGLYGGSRLMTVRSRSDEVVREGVTIARDLNTVHARWVTISGDALADVLTIEADRGVISFDEWTADPLGLGVSSVARVPVDGGFVHVFGSRNTIHGQVHRLKEVLAWLLRDVPGAGPEWTKRGLGAALREARLAFVVGYDFEASEAYEAVARLGFEPVFLDAEAVLVEGAWNYADATAFDATFDALLTRLVALAREADVAPFGAVASAMADAKARGVYRPSEEVVEPEGLYLATLAEVAFGLWSGKGDADGFVFEGMYGCSEPDALAATDPAGAALVRALFGDRCDMDTLIDPGFEGRFHMDARADLDYTRRSRHLVRAALRGFYDSGLVGNGFDNELAGNAGRNTLVGGAGRDVAVFQGAQAEYTIERIDGAARVTDTVPDRDGQDLCLGIEVLRFADGEVEVARSE